MPKLRADGKKYIYEDEVVMNEWRGMGARMRDGPIGNEVGGV